VNNVREEFEYYVDMYHNYKFWELCGIILFVTSNYVDIFLSGQNIGMTEVYWIYNNVYLSEDLFINIRIYLFQSIVSYSVTITL